MVMKPVEAGLMRDVDEDARVGIFDRGVDPAVDIPEGRGCRRLCGFSVDCWLRGKIGKGPGRRES